MSRTLFLGSAVAVGLLSVVVVGPYIHDRPPEPHQSARAYASPSPTPSPTSAASPATAAVDPPSGGVPIGLIAVGGLALLAAGAGVGLRGRAGSSTGEPMLRHRWWCVLTEHTAAGERKLQAGQVEFPARTAVEVEREVVRRYEARYGRAPGTVHLCKAEPAWPWTILAGPRRVAEGVAPLEGTAADEAAAELLEAYARARGLGWGELRGLRCVVHGPDGIGEADGRDW